MAYNSNINIGPIIELLVALMRRDAKSELRRADYKYILMDSKRKFIGYAFLQ
jgi:hypothetical protein